MTELRKASLAAVDKNGKVSDEIDVQFNPTTLRLQMANSIDTGNSRGRQVWRYNGTSSTTLTAELIFDSADEGTAATPSDVRDKTAMVRRFMLPKEKSTDAPPSVRFHWGSFVLTGVMTSASEDLELFTAEGTPQRAKMSISIKEQDPRFAAPPDSSGRSSASGSSDATAPPPFGPGGTGLSPSSADRLGEALDGESAADFLARNGLDPQAWRAVANGLDDALSLPAGEPIGFSLDLPVGGIAIGGGGFALGGSADAGLRAGLSGTDAAAGFALSAAGGLTAAAQADAGTRATQEADATRTAFGTPAAPTSPAATASAATDHARLRDVAGARTAPPAPAPPASAPPQADRRAVSFGQGVPLRDRFAPSEAAGTDAAWVTVARRAPANPARPVGAASCGCGCGGGCR